MTFTLKVHALVLHCSNPMANKAIPSGACNEGKWWDLECGVLEMQDMHSIPLNYLLGPTSYFYFVCGLHPVVLVVIACTLVLKPSILPTLKKI